MTAPKLKPTDLPGWPAMLDSRLAAAYLGVGVELFLEEVKAGIWPPPARRGDPSVPRKRQTVTWDRAALDEARERVAAGATPVPPTPGPANDPAALDDLDLEHRLIKGMQDLGKLRNTLPRRSKR